ncbi:putative reverse transcriptase domain-containing protein [Tanacetum coccineum]
MMNVIPPDHVDDVLFVEPNQRDDVPIVPEPVLVDEDEDLEEDELEEEEDDMEVDIEEDENEPELTYPYEELTYPIEHEDETVPASVHKVGESSTAPFLYEDCDGLLPGLMAHALVEKNGKAKDEYYSKLILDLGNEVRSSVEQGTAAMEMLVENLGNTEDKVECKKLKKELEEARFSNTFLCMQNERVKRDLYWTRVRSHEFYQEMIRRGFMFEERPNEAINVLVKDEERVVELRRWFEKTESVFEISECAECKKVKFAGATLEGPALTWWKTKVATMGLEIVNQMPWTQMRELMTTEFCSIGEVQRMEHELWNLKVREYDVVAYTQRFNELALMCPRMVEPESVKVDAYIRGLTDNIKGDVTSSKPADLNEAVRMAHKLMEQKSIAKSKEMREPWLPLLLMESFLCVNDVLLAMLAAIKSRFGGNDESKKMQRNVLKHQFENFTTALNESLDKAYDRFQKLISQLEVHAAPVSKEDINQKFLRSLPPSFSQIALIMRNKPDIDQTDIDDLYNNLRVYEDEMKRSSSSTSNSQNLAFLSSENTSSTNEVSTASGNFRVNTAGGTSSTSQGSSTPGADEVVCSFFAQQTTSPPLDNEDLQQIDQDDLEELDIRWQSKAECYNYHRKGHFAKECKSGRNQGKRSYGDNGRRNAITNEPSSQALVAQDGLGGYD